MYRLPAFPDLLSGAYRMPLLASKLRIPSPTSQPLRRPALLARLDEGARHRLTLLVAPAGFGKSTLLAEWSRHAHATMPLAWLTLEPGDDEPARFLGYLLAALRTAQGAEPGAALPVEGALLELVSAATASATDLALVLDDLHHLQDPTAVAALAFLVEHLPPSVHFLFASREEPPLPLARLRLAGQLTDLRANDLRFSPDETAALLRGLWGREPAGEEVRLLAERTTGWAALLHLSALALHERGGLESGGRLSASHPYLQGYLEAEVIEPLPTPLQPFLLYTALGERLCAPLCRALLEAAGADPDSAEPLLDAGAARGLLHPEAPGSAWYRYPPLLAEALRQRLRRTQPALLPELHRRAAHWYAAAAPHERDLLSQAIHHALAAGEWELAAPLVEQALTEATDDQAEAWLAALPAEVVQGRPLLRQARTRQVKEGPPQPSPLPETTPLATPLTERERELLQLLPSSLSSREMAERLIIAVSTARWYIKSIYRKLGAHHRGEAIARARALGLLKEEG